MWGEFENYPHNPVLTNRNKAPYIIQGIGHGDLIQDSKDDWHILSLGFRQMDLWMPYHNLGREVFLTPVTFHEDGWFTAGNDGTADETYEIDGDFEQTEKSIYTFENTDWNKEWCYLRHPHAENYELYDNRVVLHGTDITLDQTDSPTFIGIRQMDFCAEISCSLKVDGGEAGITAYMCESEHYEVCLRKENGRTEAALRLNIGGIKHIQNMLSIGADNAVLIIRADRYNYNFFVKTENGEQYLGSGVGKYLTSEVSGGFTGVVLGLYAVGNNTAEFCGFKCEYSEG